MERSSFLRGPAALCVATVCLLGGVHAADPAAVLAGRVLDQDGRAVAGAIVELECVAGMPAGMTTDASGRFSFVNLPAGTCALTVRAKGFEDIIRDTVELYAGQTLETTLQLKVAVVREVVNVVRERELMQNDLTVNDVRESAGKDVGEALTQIDGVWKVRRGGIGNDIVLRGYQHGNLGVLIDGARIYGACPSSMDPIAYHVDFAEIEQVRVTKGPFDVKNQGGLGGAIEIVNRSPVAGLAIRPTFGAGSFGFYNPAITASKGTNAIKILGGYSYRTGQPYKDGQGRSFTEYANYSTAGLEQRAFDIHTGWFDTEFTPSAGQRVSLAYTRQQSGLVLYPYLLMDAKYDNADRIRLQYEIRNVTSSLTALRLQTYLTQVKHFMTDEQRRSAAAAAGPFSMATNASTLTAGGHMEAEMAGGFSLGIEMFQRNWNAMNYMRTSSMRADQAAIPDVAVLASGAYLDYAHRIGERIRISGGVRLDHNAMDTAGWAATDLYYAYRGTRRISASDTAPSANLRLTMTGPKSLELLAGAGSAVRFPDAQERFFQQKKAGQDVVGNPLLSPTRNTESTIGFRYKWGGSYVESELFYSALTDFITVNNQARINTVPGVMNSKARSYENVSARIYGGESTYALVLPRQVLLSGGISYSRGTKETRAQAHIMSSNVVEMPPLRAWTSLRYTHRRFFAEATGIAVNRQGRVDTDLNESPTAGYGLMNLHVGIHSGKLYLILFVDNVFNRQYFEHFSAQRDPFRAGTKIPEPGRNVFATISYSF